MPIIRLKTGELVGAKTGTLGIVPFKCWDKHGTDKLLKRIQARVDEKRQYFVCGPVKGLINASMIGGKHSAKTRAKIGNALRGRKKADAKNENAVNVPQLHRGWRGVSERDKARWEVIKATRVRMEGE